MGTIKHLQRQKIKIKGTFKKGKKINRNCQLEKCWVWPEKVENKIKPLIKGISLNVCAGLSPLGDIKIDIEQHQKDIIITDMSKLPFDDNTFDTVISDPPWKINFFHRQRPFFEAVRVCKVNGRIIYNCTWKPVSKYVKLEKVYLRTDNHWANISAIWIFKKTAEII